MRQGAPDSVLLVRINWPSALVKFMKTMYAMPSLSTRRVFTLLGPIDWAYFLASARSLLGLAELSPCNLTFNLYL